MRNVVEDGDVLDAPSEVATRLKLTEQTLANMRWKGEGPPFIKLGDGRFAPVRYKRSDVDAWLQSRRVSTVDA